LLPRKSKKHGIERGATGEGPKAMISRDGVLRGELKNRYFPQIETRKPNKCCRVKKDGGERGWLPPTRQGIGTPVILKHGVFGGEQEEISTKNALALQA